MRWYVHKQCALIDHDHDHEHDDVDALNINVLNGEYHLIQPKHDRLYRKEHEYNNYDNIWYDEYGFI